MSFFIANAVADTGAPAPEGNPYIFVIMLVVLMLIFYFMSIRPQQKRAKAHNQLISSLTKGDEVLTNGGLIGRIIKVNDNGYIVLELNENNQVVIKRDFIASVLPKGTLKSL